MKPSAGSGPWSTAAEGRDQNAPPARQLHGGRNDSGPGLELGLWRSRDGPGSRARLRLVEGGSGVQTYLEVDACRVAVNLAIAREILRRSTS